MRIAILPVGSVDEEVLDEVRLSLSDVFHEADVSILREVMSLPVEAYNPQRGQYQSSRVLSCIKLHMMGVDRVLGITEADLYAPNLNFVFGEAQMTGGAAIISLRRLKPEFYGEKRNRALFLERSVKEAIHEIGHTLGLRHCHDQRCVMFFSNSILDTDAKTQRFCEICHMKVLKKAKKPVLTGASRS